MGYFVHLEDDHLFTIREWVSLSPAKVSGCIYSEYLSFSPLDGVPDCFSLLHVSYNYLHCEEPHRNYR